MTSNYWTTEEIAALSNDELAALERLLRSQENLAHAERGPRGAKLHKRASFLLERMVWPEQNRRRK